MADKKEHEESLLDGVLTGRERFKKLFKQAEIAQYDEKERRQYESSLKEYWDYTNTLDTAYMKGEKAGEEKGRIEGRAEGRADEKTDTARRMKAKGFATEDIAEITGLTIEEIERL